MRNLKEKISIETKRLIIDELSEVDKDFYIHIEQIDENKRFEMSGVLEQSKIVEKFYKFLHLRTHLPHHGAIMFIVKLKDDTPIGYISLICNWEKTKEWELGYSFLPSYFRQGFAYESIQSVIAFLFQELKIHKLMAFVNADNKPSVKLLEKLEMIQEGHMREARLINDEWADEKVFSLINSRN